MILAHVKWFVDNAAQVAPYSITEPTVWIWLGAGIALVALAYILERFVPEAPKNFLKWAKKTRSTWIYVFQLTLALSLLFAAWNQVILVPHYEAENLGWPIVQSVIALLLILNRGIDYAAVLLLATYLGAAINHGPLEALDYINIVGMASFLALSKASWEGCKKYRKKALPSLRIFTGLALVVLAISEKLGAPDQAVVLLGEYNMNFMAWAGMTDRTFVLSAGAMEAVFGIIMISGWITRINVIALAVFLVSSNLYFLFQGYSQEALVELLGHLPVIGTAVLLIIYGKE